MATGLLEKSDLDIFKRYIDERCGGSLGRHSLAEAIEKFREYQQQLSALQERLRLSEESAEREGTRPLTDEIMEATFVRLDAKLDQEEIAD
ncbi:MAG: hypothetical protein GXP28_07335 [Planctomycetes bacterium]|nr:hypothetical protein [Planctomycetota bacterium]